MLEDCGFVRRSDRIAEWTVPGDGGGARYVQDRFDEGRIVTPAGDAYRFDIDYGEQMTQLIPTGTGLLARGPASTEAHALLEFAIDTAAAGCLGPLAALAPGRYLLVRSPLRPVDSGYTTWGNDGGYGLAHCRQLHRPRWVEEAPAKRYGPSGKALPPAPPKPRSTVHAQIVGSPERRPPCVRQPLVGMVALDWNVGYGGIGVFLAPLAEPAGEDVPDDDLLLVVPLDAPWLADRGDPVLDEEGRAAWAKRANELAGSLSWVED